MVRRWLGEDEGGWGVGFYRCGEFVGVGFLSGVVMWIEEMLRWEWVLIVSGGMGIMWWVIWFKVYEGGGVRKGMRKGEVD